MFKIQFFGQLIRQSFEKLHSSPLVQETAERLLAHQAAHPPLTEFPTLEKVVYLFNSDFFHRMQSETLVALADRATIKTYSNGEAITEAGDICFYMLASDIYYLYSNELLRNNMYCKI